LVFCFSVQFYSPVHIAAKCL